MKKQTIRFLSFIICLCLIATTAIIGVSAREVTFLQKGCDVSHYQGDVNWETLKSRGVDFVILRCYCYGEDKKFAENYDGAKAAGLDVGAYMYMYAEDADEAVSEAQATVSVLGGRSLDYPLFLDVEDECLKHLGVDTLGNYIQTELDIFEQAGYIPAIYTFTSFMNNYLDMSRFPDYDMWLAYWPSFPGTYADFSDIPPEEFDYDFAMWQFTSDGDGKYLGMSSDRLDLNYCYKDYSKKKTAKGYERNANNYMINDLETTAGWESLFNTKITTSVNCSQGSRSFLMLNETSQAQEIGDSKIGALAQCNYDEPMNLTKYEYIAFDYYLSHDFNNQDSYLELNFCTDNIDDGFQLKIDISNQTAGWHSINIKKSDIPKNPRATFDVEPTWSKITNLRWSWWNICQRTDVVLNILLDNLRALNYGTAQPGGNILKVTYSNEDPSVPGYKYLDLTAATIYKGWMLSYDVYLEDDVKGIGGIDLDDKYDNYSRDNANFFDQNNKSGHPKTDISDFAYKKWYHREILLPDHWNGVGYANFYTMIAFDGGFSGEATAYFDNIKLIDYNGNVAEYSFLDGGDEYNYVNNAETVMGGQIYLGTNYNGVNASVVSYESVFAPKEEHTLTVSFTKDAKKWENNDRSYTLKKDGEDFTPAEKTGSLCTFKVKDGQYKLFENGVDTGLSIAVLGDTSYVIDYFTLSTAGVTTDDKIKITVKRGETEVKNGDVILNNDFLELYASDPGFTEGKSFFTWSNGQKGAMVLANDVTNLPTVSVQRILWGDANGDNLVDASDSLLVLQASIEKVKITGNYASVIVVAGETGFSSVDALLILQKSINLIEKFPVQK